MKPMEYPRIGVGVFALNRKGQVVMARRLSEWGHGYLSLPGGKIELFDTAVDTATRELEEETNLEPYWPGKFPFIGYLDEPDMDNQQHWVTMYFGGAVSNPEELRRMEPDKSGEWGWYDLPDPSDPFPAELNVWPRIQQFITSRSGIQFVRSVHDAFHLREKHRR